MYTLSLQRGVILCLRSWLWNGMILNTKSSSTFFSEILMTCLNSSWISRLFATYQFAFGKVSKINIEISRNSTNLSFQGSRIMNEETINYFSLSFLFSSFVKIGENFVFWILSSTDNYQTAMAVTVDKWAKNESAVRIKLIVGIYLTKRPLSKPRMAEDRNTLWTSTDKTTSLISTIFACKQQRADDDSVKVTRAGLKTNVPVI